MEKNELIRKLGECVRLEKGAVPVYSRHLEDPEFLSAFTPQHQRMVTGILNELRADSLRHQLIFEAMLRSVESAAQDVY